MLIFISMKTTYEKTVHLEHNESLLKLDNITGDISPIKHRPNNIPIDSEVWLPNAIFQKDYTNSWRFLDKHLSAIEMKAAKSLAIRAKAFTNSLQPLDDETTIPELMLVLGLGKNSVTPVLAKLFDIGVYGRFHVKNWDIPYTCYWLLNPYLTFNGKISKYSISSLFADTHIAKAFYNPNYEYKYIKSKTKKTPF